MQLVSIVIPIFNRLEVTKTGLKSLHRSLARYSDTFNPNFKFEIVVVDDGSTDGSSEWIAATYPEIVLLKGDGNLWWTGSVDYGSKYAVNVRNADYVLLWNDDLECDQNYFPELVKAMNLNSQMSSSILVSKILWSDQKNILFNFGCTYDAKTGKKKLLGTNQPDIGFEHITEVDWSGGMGTLIPKEALIKINFFDPANFPQYHGDSDMFLRAKKAGFKIFAVPSLKIYNDRRTTGVKQIKKLSDLKAFFVSNRSNYNLIQNVKFTQRHAKSPIAWAYLTVTYLKVLSISLRNFI